jgi:cbb3-type cytochrome oxidase subunit 3
MTDSIQFFLSQPLWFTVSFVTAYLGLLGYVAYILWDYRRRQYDE